MSKKHHGGPAPVPPANRPQAGPPTSAGNTPDLPPGNAATGASFEEQDAKRRLGDFTGTGEHSRQQPGMLNDGDLHSK